MQEIEAKILNVRKDQYEKLLSMNYEWKNIKYDSLNWGNIRFQNRTLIRKIKRNYDEIDGIRISISREINLNIREKPRTRPNFIRKINRYSYDDKIYTLYASEVVNQTEYKEWTSYEIELELTGDFIEENINTLISEARRIKDLISLTDKQDKSSSGFIYDEINSILGYNLKFSLNKPIQIRFSDIRDNLLSYGITIKVDGIRYFLYMNETGAYLMGRDIIKISNEEFSKRLYDIELVDKDAYIIDMLILNGNNISHMKLKDRYDLFQEIKVGDYNVHKKEFKFPTTSKAYFRDIKSLIDIQDITKPYSVDGIIFTPNARYGYPTSFKWKPINKLTIDVRLRDRNLYVYDSNKKKEVIFDIDADIFGVTRYRDLNEQILEIRYNLDDNSFSLYRVRRDVTVPNDLKTALQIWRQLQNPITEDDLLSNNLTLMRKYHNRVKFSIYNLLSDFDKRIILDVGSGRGGDILKWKENNLFVVAIEPDKENYDEFKERTKTYKYDNIKLLEMGLEEFNTKYEDKFEAITFFNSVTFFTPQQISDFTEHLEKNSILVVLGMDKERFLEVFPQDVDTDNYKIEHRGDKVFIQIKDSIVRGQEENMFDFNELRRLLPEYEVLRDFYLDEERLMSKEAKDLSKCYRATIFWKKPTRIIRETTDLEMNEIKRVRKSMFGNNAIRIGTIADGSCFFHSILTAIDDEYLQMNKIERKKRIKEFRQDLSSYFTQDEYDKLANGNIASLGKQINEYSYDRMLKKLKDTRIWVGNEFLDFICKTLNINIYIISDRNWEVYKQGVEKEYLYNERNPTIIILWQGGVHYELLGIYNNDKIQVLFEPDNQISKIMYYIS